jgi:cytidylate kinase
MARGADSNYDEVFSKVNERDRIDSTRDVAPLRAADDAVVIDSDRMDADEVFETVLALCK